MKDIPEYEAVPKLNKDQSGFSVASSMSYGSRAGWKEGSSRQEVMDTVVQAREEVG